MVTKLGMDKEIGLSTFKENNYGKKNYSEDTNKEIDKRIFSIIDMCRKRTMKLIKDKENEIKELSETLLEKETLDLQQITEILGERPFEPKSTFKEYLKEVKKI
jgi:AFG3 family protein